MDCRITGEMLATWEEVKLIRWIQAWYVFSDGRMKGIEGLASIAKVKRAEMIAALNGKRSIGGDAWARIEKHFKIEIHREWMKARRAVL